MRAWVLEIEGEIAGIAGYYFTGGTAVVFSEMRRAIPAAVIWRESIEMMRKIKFPAICVAQDGSGRFLERLGWVTEDGEVYKWRL